MMAYARLYDCDRLALLYPAVPGEAVNDVELRGLACGSERLDVASLPLNHSPAEIRAALRSLVDIEGSVSQEQLGI